MKHKILSILTLAILILAIGCKKDEPGIPNINVAFKFEPETPAAGETVTFTNSSNGGTKFAWEFGDSQTSTDKNPTHVYQNEGQYAVTLMVDGYKELTVTKTVTVGTQAPAITKSIEIIETGVEVTFTASIYNPTSAAVTYKWEFPAGVAKGDVDDAGVANGESIKVIFNTAEELVGHLVKVTASMNSKDYVKSENIVVKNQLAKTMYIAQKNGNLWFKKLYTKGEADLTDMNIASGAHPLTLAFDGDRLYVFDAGNLITYSTAIETTPGSIVSMKYDGSEFTNHFTFDINSPYDDAFFGFVKDGYIYWTDRRNDITKAPTSTQNVVWGNQGPDNNPAEFPLLVQNNTLGYYGQGLGFGHLNGTVAIYNGMYWWAKNSNGKGIFRFVDSDIKPVYSGPYTPADLPAGGRILADYAVRSFAIDEVNQQIYFASNNGLKKGFFKADLEGSNVMLLDSALADGEGGANELTFITGVVIDNESGYVYWAYRGPTKDAQGNPIDLNDPNFALYRSGIKKYKLDGTQPVGYFIPDVEAYGLTIDHTKR